MYPGGASTAVLETMRHLADLGYEVHIVSVRQPGDLAQRFPTLHFHVLGGALPSDVRYWLNLGALQRQFGMVLDALKPDYLIASVFPANYWAFLYRRRNSAMPCIWYCQEPSAFIHDRAVIAGIPGPMRLAAILGNLPLQVIDRWLVRYADAITANSNYSAGRIRAVYGREATIVRLGVDVRRAYQIKAKEQLVLTVGRLTQFKRLDLFIRAAALLKAHGGPQARWVIAGDGEERANLEELAERLAVTDIVHFAGRLGDDELAGYYARARIVTVTAIGEPFGLVAIEGMAAGAAIVCSDSGGPAETVVPGVTGLHFRSGDARDLARQVGLLLDNPNITEQYGVTGRQGSADYSWENTARQFDQLLRAIPRAT
jgi:glycosyltransferase involved in cell wall biosynthesis